MSVFKSYLSTHHGERIDQPDFQHAAEVSQLAGLLQMVDKVLVGEDTDDTTGGAAQSRKWILRGFEITNTSSKIVTVSRGVGLLGIRDQGEVKYGLILAGGGEATQSVDISSFAAGMYTVWVRGAMLDAQPLNRLFWNSTASTPVEYVRNIHTRLEEDWQIAIELTSPGDEWVAIGTVDQAALLGDSSGTGVTDTRDLFFEGRVAASYAIENADWGGGTDRDTDRGTNGVFGFARWIRAIERQVQDMIHGPVGTYSTRSWRTLIPTGYGLIELVNERLDRRGRTAPIGVTGRMAGHLDPDTDDTWDISDDTTPRRWREIHARVIELGEAALDSAARALFPRITARMSDVAGRRRTRFALFENVSSVASSRTHVYLSAEGPEAGGQLWTLEVAINCTYDNATDTWTEDSATTKSYLVVFGRGATNSEGPVTVYVHGSDIGGHTTPWPHTPTANATTGWDRILSLWGDGSLHELLSVTAGSYLFSPAPTFRKALHPASISFDDSSVSSVAWKYNFGAAVGSAKYVEKTAGGSPLGAMWPFEPPNGATITAVRVNGAFTLGGGSFVAAVVRSPNSGAAAESMNSGLSQTLSGAVGDYSLTIDQNNVVDTDAYSYGIYFLGSASSTCLIYRAEVEYTMTTLAMP